MHISLSTIACVGFTKQITNQTKVPAGGGGRPPDYRSHVSERDVMRGTVENAFEVQPQEVYTVFSDIPMRSDWILNSESFDCISVLRGRCLRKTPFPLPYREKKLS